MDRAIRQIVLIASILLLALSGGWLVLETSWRSDHAAATPSEAFSSGPIGLDLAPLKYVAVLPRISGKHFTIAENTANIWAAYGFITPARQADRTCISNLSEWAPTGMTVSNHFPGGRGQGATQFAGLTCAACHTGRIPQQARTPGPAITGMGNHELAFGAFQADLRKAVAEASLTADAIMTAYDDQCAETDGGALTDLAGDILDRINIWLWLRQMRAQQSPAAQRGGDGGLAGRGRIFALLSPDLPPAKIPALWGAADRPMPSTHPLRGLPITSPDFASNRKLAAAFISQMTAPKFTNAGFDPLPEDDVKAGFILYMRHCNQCHGHRPEEGGEWSTEGAFRLGQISRVAGENATYFDVGADPALAVAARTDDGPGYLNAPIPGAWLRAPYLHNGSVPTLRQLINLEKRQQTFCRGANPYDPQAGGLSAPAPWDGTCPDGMTFIFDAAAPGDRNIGHNYPWAYDDGERSPDNLHVLLAYLKTL